MFENNLIVQPGNLVHIIKFDYFTTTNPAEIKNPVDWIMWEKINGFLQKNTEYSCVYTSKLTCYKYFELFCYIFETKYNN